jgi:2-polyprenyl-3-methyl-5-hydroxy-6-metoxy-1,4-benzoquinol methylase
MAVNMEPTRVPERFVPDAMREELIAAEHLARYEWAASLAVGRRVLDAGCGTGYGAVILARAGAERVVGVDAAAAVVEAARSYETPALTFAQADIARLPHPDASFDLITCFEVIEHVHDAGAVLGELARVLAPGGVLAISSPNADRYPPGNPHHVREFTTGEFHAMLAETFPEVRLLAQHQWVSSAVFEERDLEPGAAAVRTIKVAGREIGSETYTVALAGSRSLPEPPPVAALTGTVEVRRWLEHFDSQQQVLAEQADYLARLEALDAERRELRTHLVGAETELAELRERTFLLERDRFADAERAADTAAELAHVREELGRTCAKLGRAHAVMDEVWASVSWRSTRPLRALKRLVRRR